MYRYGNGQISLSDFQQPMGMHLREDNRWVKKAQSIPWDKIEAKYADLFPSETGNVAKPLQLALGSCLIQREYGYSDVETVLQIQENPYLQYFCGYAGYDDSKLPFDASSMVHFRKRLTPEILAQINEMVIQEAQKTEDSDNQDDNKPDGGGNSGTIIVDATCAPSNIRYPQDVSLLNEARENAVGNFFRFERTKFGFFQKNFSDRLSGTKKAPITSRGCNRGRNRKSPLTEISGLKSYELIVCYRNLSAIAEFQTHFWRKLGVNWRKLWRKHRQFRGNQ